MSVMNRGLRKWPKLWLYAGSD